MKRFVQKTGNRVVVISNIHLLTLTEFAKVFVIDNRAVVITSIFK